MMEWFNATAFIAIIWTITACGSRPQHQPDLAEKTSPQALTTGQGPQAAGEAGIHSRGTPIPIVGTYQQDQNAAVRLIVYTDLLLDTNLAVPLDPASGSRLTPQLPHRLRWDDTNGYYTTDTYFNMPGGATKNAEFRVDAYDNGDKLDVTIIVMLPPTPFTPAVGGSASPCGATVTKSVNSSTSTPTDSTNGTKTPQATVAENGANGEVTNFCGHDKPIPPQQPDQQPGQQPSQQPGQQPCQPSGCLPTPKPTPDPTPKPCPPQQPCNCGSGNCTNTNTNTTTVTVNVTCSGAGSSTPAPQETRFLYHFIRL